MPNIDKKHQRKIETAENIRKFSQMHTWTRAVAQTVARSTIGAFFDIVPHEKFREEGKNPDKKSKDVLDSFFDGFYLAGVNDNIHDTDGISKKIMYSVTSAILYGQFTWEIIRDSNGLPLGFYALGGMTIPNVDEMGYFKRPAYYHKAWNNKDWVEYQNPNDLFYFFMPGTSFNIEGESDLIAALPFAVTSDIFASNSYKSIFENQNAPFDGVWQVDTDDPEEFQRAVEMISKRYQGHENAGRNPIVGKGNIRFEPIRSRSNDDAPYLQGREYNQLEISAVTGVSSLKMGLTGEKAKAFYREARRDFHENTLNPLLRMIEEAIYIRLCVGEFGIRDWVLKFNSPDLTTQLEESTILTRYIQNRVLTPNEVRNSLGYETVDGNDELYGPPGYNKEESGGPGDEEEGNNSSSRKPEKPPSDEQNPDDEDRND